MRAEINDGQLVCPFCKDTYLHQGRVTVLNRVREDGPGFETIVKGPLSSTSFVEAKDMPGRRESLQIEFECEMCRDKKLTLQILQHKGSTYLDWIES